MFFICIIISIACLCREGNAFWNTSSSHCTRSDTIKLICHNKIPRNVEIGATWVQINLKPELNATTTIIAQSNFSSYGWNNVTYLEINALDRNEIFLGNECFSTLILLKELHLHVKEILLFSPNTFVGTDLVRTLDLSDCARIFVSNFMEALNGTNKLPKLQNLILSRLRNLKSSLAIDERFVQTLAPRNITSFDFSGTQVMDINISALLKNLKDIKMVNASNAIISKITFASHSIDEQRHVKMLDVSHTKFPVNAIPIAVKSVSLSNLFLTVSNTSYIHLAQFLNTVESLNASGISESVSYRLENISVIFENPDERQYLKTLIVSQNNLKWMNVKLICNKFNFSSIEMIDISKNKMEFLHPSTLSCIPNLRKINLSNNKLNVMLQKNSTLFGTLLAGIRYILHVDLSNNKLKYIPVHFFQSKRHLEVINLSNNELNQVTFALHDLENLHVLDLRGNNIQILNQLSLTNLNSIPTGNDSSSQTSILLKSNPILCSKCAAKPFIQWLLSTTLIDLKSSRLKCIKETGMKEEITSSILKNIQKICERKRIIISLSVTTLVFVTIATMFVVFLYNQYKNKEKTRYRTKLIDRLRQGKGKYEFVAFISFSNDDGDFVNENILSQLNDTLQQMTGIDRELVCTGDRNFRPGFYVHEETYRLLDKASVLLVVLSKHFCQSNYCKNELDQAFVKRKPIVAMYKEQVEEETMTPTIKELYKSKVRVLWTLENGEYVLKTTWENVCDSILDLAA